MRPGQRRALPDTPEGRLDDLFETAKAHLRAKVERTRSEAGKAHCELAPAEPLTAA
jgi:hypothetical protein